MESDNMSPAQLQQLRQAFMTFDSDHSGTIDLDEFKYACKKLKVPLSDEDAREVFERADRNGDGSIDFNEFKELSRAMLLEKHAEDDIQDLFDLLTDKRTKKITMRTLRRAVADWGLSDRITDSDVDAMFFAGDTNSDRSIDRAEFDEIIRQCRFSVDLNAL